MVWQDKELLKLEDGCIPRLLKGRHAACYYQRNNRRLLEAVGKGKLFLTNFIVTLKAASGNHRLVGTLVVHYDTEAVTVFV